ncbi:uncharacterized protein LOC142224028 [Haematobia irritans]|uniref:uncharacterized protein LOC142224028 n=1 Tax=Haematobia irritans TaxID=7368 RepID=UPI003F4F8B76
MILGTASLRRTMQFLLFIVFIFQISHATNNEYLDPSDEAGNAELWKNLFIKLNKVLSEIEILQQGLDDITKRQNDMDARLIKLTETLNGVPMEMSKSKNDLENQITTKLEDIRLGLCEATQSQWTTILRRQDGSVNFYRKWMEYKNGFGNPDGDFFICLEMLHILTNGNRSQELLVVLTDYDGETRYAKYDLFRVGNESEQYAIVELGTYSGDAGDGMGWHRGKKFSTLDRVEKKELVHRTFKEPGGFTIPAIVVTYMDLIANKRNQKLGVLVGTHGEAGIIP